MYLQILREVPPWRADLLLAAGVVLALAVQGCSAFRIPEEPRQPTPLTPVWSTEELYEHIRYLNRSDVAGRATGTQGYARAAAYVAARMAEFGLQPAIEGDFRTIYGAPINYPVAADLRAVTDVDSLVFLSGIDFLPDGRTDSGAVAVSRFVIAGTGADPTARRGGHFGVIVPPGENADLAAWRAAGAELAILVDELSPQFAEAPIPGMVIMQLVPGAAGRLIRISEASVAAYLTERSGEEYVLGRTVRARVTTSSQRRAGAINMLAYVSGKHPVRREQLIVVCSDLDAMGQYAGVNTMDFRNFGTSTAALLEVARNLGYVTRRWQVPDRSVMIAVWSGSRIGYSGLRQFLNNPTWSTLSIASVVYVGLPLEEQPQVEDLLAGYGIPLVAIPPPPGRIYPDELLLLPDPTLQRIARSRDPEFLEVEAPDMSQLIDSAAVRALDLADRTYRSMMIETTHPDPFIPVREDSLLAPSAAQTD